MQRRHLLCLALVTALTALPAASQKGKGPKTLVYIDVATHNFAGMPDFGGLGGFMAKRMGGDTGPKGYPESRNIPAGTGKFLDIALYNGLKPGVEAQQLVPAGLAVGKSLPLLPPVIEPGGSERYDGKIPDVEVKIYQSGGCGGCFCSCTHID